jgi:hypothetical protein
LEALAVLLLLLKIGRVLDFEKLLVLETLEFLELQILLQMVLEVQVYLIQLLMQ